MSLLQLPNDYSAFKRISVPNDLPVISASSFMQLHVPTSRQQVHNNSLSHHFKRLGFYHPAKMLANNDLYPSLLHPIPLTNRANHDRQASMANITTRCLLLLAVSNGTATTMATPNLLLLLVQDDPAIMMETHTNDSFQLIVKSFSEGSQQVIPFTIRNESFKLIDAWASEGALLAQDILKMLLMTLQIHFNLRECKHLQMNPTS
jgi:hypothetical protein